MELESADGSKIPIDIDSDTVIGRGLGLPIPTTDRTIARRHLSLRLLSADAESNAVSRVSFQVIGKNPVLTHTSSGEKRVYRESEKGDLLPGDRISLSLKHPSFFTLVKREGGEAAVDKTVLDAVARRERRTHERRKEKEQMEDLGDQAGDDDGDDVLDLELGSLDVSQIDPIKEFGFLVNGNEFDVYPKKMIRPAMNWNWFLEEERRVDNDDEDMGETTSSKGMKRGKGRGRRKKRGGDDEDDVWTGESEDEKELAVRAGGIKRSKYSTRLKDSRKLCREALSGRGSSSRMDAKSRDDELEEEEEEEEEDEEDETLGGFIIDDDEELVDEEEEEEELEDEEEEEELEDEEEEDED